MKLISKFSLMLFLALLLNSCTTYYTPDDFLDFSNKMTESDFSNYKDFERSLTTLKIGNDEYNVYAFPMVVGTITTTSTSSGANNTSHTSTHTSQFPDNYLFVYKNRKFFYSGFLYEFLNNSDKSIEEVGNKFVINNTSSGE